MGTKEKLRERFLTMPSDFTFEEMQRLLEGYGYIRSNKGRTSSSRLIFKMEINVLSCYTSHIQAILLKSMP